MTNVLKWYLFIKRFTNFDLIYYILFRALERRSRNVLIVKPKNNVEQVLFLILC